MIVALKNSTKRKKLPLDSFKYTLFTRNSFKRLLRRDSFHIGLENWFISCRTQDYELVVQVQLSTGKAEFSRNF